VLNLEVNGRVPDLAQTQRLATRNYGHFTSMQVRDGRVRGLALHMARLDDGNEEFFGARMDVTDEHRVRELIRHAMGDARDASVRVGFVPGADGTPPDVLVSVSDPAADAPGPPLRVRTQRYERDWPEHKHASTMGLTVALRQARLAGYDDALFTGPDDQVREGTTWNVAFWDGTQVIWPRAPVLKGVTMVLLQIAMTMNGTPWTLRPVERGELPDLLAAAAANSLCPARPIDSIDGVKFPEGERLAGVLTAAWDTVPQDEI
jgi:branched-subunit amino acid aminotransferase/4-amino-4-deoxychorismate lyase